MPVLRERIGWSRPRRPRGPDLTPDEATHVKAALAFLAARYKTWPALAVAMGLKLATVRYAACKGKGVSAGVALRAARAAGVPLEELLAGTWPPTGACPVCGRGVGSGNA
jgi:hypothetical protein